MGVDLDVIFPASLTADEAFALPDRLNTEPPVVAACHAYFEHMKQTWPGLEPRPWHWQGHRPAITAPSMVAEAWRTPHLGEVSLLGTPGFLHVQPHRIRHSSLNLHAFATDHAGWQAPIRRVCRAIAHVLGTDRVLYLPDSGDWAPGIDDLSRVPFDEVLERLAAWGPPVSAIGALAYGRAVRSGFHYADGALRHPDGTPVSENEIMPGRGWIWSAGVTRYSDGTLVPAEELARPDLRGGFAYYVDDFDDLA